MPMNSAAKSRYVSESVLKLTGACTMSPLHEPTDWPAARSKTHARTRRVKDLDRLEQVLGIWGESEEGGGVDGPLQLVSEW